MPDTDPLSSALEEIRERDTAGITGHPWVENVPRLLAALDAVLGLHSRREKPSHCYDLDLRCAAHDWTKNAIHRFEVVRDCPDCTYRDRWYCTHCDHEEWPCPTYSAVAEALTGEGGDEA
jgi:hypothetical protein